MRTFISLTGLEDRHNIVQELTEVEFNAVWDVASRLSTRDTQIRLEKLPYTKDVIEEFKEFRTKEKYNDWDKRDIIADFVSQHYWKLSWQAMSYLRNEIINYID